MQTVITKEIDGYTVIQGFDRPLIDLEATKKVVGPLMEKTDEVKAVKKKGEELSRVHTARADLVRVAREKYRNKDTSGHAKAMYEIELRDEQIKTLSGDMQELCTARNIKAREVFRANAVHFEPKAGEDVVTDEEADTLKAAFISMPKGTKLLRDGTTVEDKRGVKYVKAGKVLTVSALGEKPDGPLLEDVTPEEFEVMRLDAMTTDEKAAELQTVLDGLAGQAANMRAKLEIQGDAEALTKAQAWYAEQVAAAEAKYK